MIPPEGGGTGPAVLALAALEPVVVSGRADGRLFVCAARGRYLHSPRTVRDHGDRQSVTAWCGVMTPRTPLWFDRPAAGFELCGTCVGRLTGLRHDLVAYQPRLPRRLPPRWCPGPTHRLVEDLVEDPRRGRCRCCGKVVRCWGRGWVRHEHDGRGVACPEHGWRDLTLRSDGSLACRAWRCEEQVTSFWLVPSSGAG